MKEISWIQDCSWECVDTGFVSYFFTFGENLLFLKSDKFGVRSLAFSFFPDLENLFSLPSCLALSTAPDLVLSSLWARELRRGFFSNPVLTCCGKRNGSQIDGRTNFQGTKKKEWPRLSFPVKKRYHHLAALPCSCITNWEL